MKSNIYFSVKILHLVIKTNYLILCKLPFLLVKMVLAKQQF